MSKKWKPQQKLLYLAGVIGIPTCLAILGYVAKFGSNQALGLLSKSDKFGAEATNDLLDLVDEIGFDEAYAILEGELNSQEIIYDNVRPLFKKAK